MLNGEKRGLPARRAMTFLGKIPAAPKPINLPSQRLENRGLDLNVDLVPKGTHTWATTGRSPPTAGSPWGNAGSPPVPTGAWGKSPTVGGHISSRPSSAETRPSSAGSMRHNNNQEQPVIASAWGGTSSRPSSASGVLGQSQSQAPPSRGGRPQSAEPRPGSAQSSSLSRFVASNEPSRNQAWANSATSLKSLEEPRQQTGFALSSVNFPSLGSEKNSDIRSQQSDKGASLLPGVNEKQEEEGAVDTWSKPQYQSMELWNEDSSIAPPLHAFPSPVLDSWHRGMHASQASGGSVAKDAWRRDPSSGVIPHVGIRPLPHDAFLHCPMDSEAIPYGSGGGGYMQGGGYRPPVDMYNNGVPYLRHRAPVSGHPAHPMGPPMYLDHPMQQYDGYYGGPRGGHPPVNMHERERMMVAGPEMHANIFPGPPPEHLHWHGQGPLPPNPRMHPEPASKYVAFDDNFEGVKCLNSAVEPKNARGFDVKDSSKREARRQDLSKNEVKIVLLSSSERGGNANRIPGKSVSETASVKEEVNLSRSALARGAPSLPLSSMDQVTSAKEDTGGVDKAAHPPSIDVPNTIVKKVGFVVEQAVQSQTLHGSQTQEAEFLIKNNSSHRIEKGRNETPSKILNKVTQEQPKEKPQAGSTINDMAQNSEPAKVSKPTRILKMEDNVAEQTLTNQSREMASSGTKPAKVKKERGPSLKVSSAEGPVSGQGHLSANKETTSVKPLNAPILSGEAVDSSCVDMMSTEGSSIINSHSKFNVQKNNEKHETSKSEALVSNSVSLVEKSIPTETGKATIVPEEHSAEYRQKQKHGAREGEKEWRRKTDLAELKPEASKSSRSAAGDDSQLAKSTAMASATSVQEVKRNSEPQLSHFDVSQQTEPYDYKAQRAKLKAVANQRAQQLQKEEEERVKEQRAKAAAKLEELNRRTMQSSSLVEVADLTAGGEAAKVAVSLEETSATPIHSQSDDGSNRRAQKKPERDLTAEKEMFKGKMKSSLKVLRMDNTGEEIHPSQDVPSKPDLDESASSLSPGSQQLPSRTQHARHKNKQGILKPVATTEDASPVAPALAGTKDTVVADGPSSDVTNVEPAALLKKKKSSRGGRNRTKADVIPSTDFSSNPAYSGEISSSDVHGLNTESSTNGGSAVHSFETQLIEMSKDGKPRCAHGPLEMQGTQSGVFDESSSGKKVQRKPQIQRRFKERGATEARLDNPTTADGLTWAPVRTEPCQSVDRSEGNIEIQAESQGGIREDVKDGSKNPAILGEHPALPRQQGNTVCPSEPSPPSQQEMESSAVEARPRSIESSRAARHHPLSWRQKQGDRHTVKQGEEQSPAEQGDSVGKTNVVEASIPPHGEGRKRMDRQSEGASPVYRANIPRNNNGGTLQPRPADPLPEARQPKRAYNAELRHQPKLAMDLVVISSEHGPVSSTVQDVAASRKEPKKEPEIDVSLQSGRAAQWKMLKQPKQLENDYQEPRRNVAIGESNTVPPLRFERRKFQEEDAPPHPLPPAVRPPHYQPRFKPPRERSADMIASEQPPHPPNTNSGEEKFPIRQKQQRAQVDGQTGNRNERHLAHKSERESHITSMPPGGIAANDENKSTSAAGMLPQSTLPPNSSRQQQYGYSRDPAKEIVGNTAPPPAYQPKKGHSSSHFQWQQASSGWSEKPKATSGRQALKSADVPMNEDSKQKHLEPSGGYVGGIPSNASKSQVSNPSFGGQDYRQAPDFHKGRKPEGGGGGRSNNQHYGGAGGGAPQGEQMENTSFRPRNSGFGRRSNSGGGGRPYVRREPDMEHRHVNQPNAISGSSSG